MADPFATTTDVINAWRPLTSAETTRADYLLRRASRDIRRLWPHVDAWITSGRVDADDVRDALVDVVVDVLSMPATGRHVATYTRTAGSESESYGLRAGADGRLVVLTPLLTDLLGDPVQRSRTPVPTGTFPKAPRFSRLDLPKGLRDALRWLR